MQDSHPSPQPRGSQGRPRTNRSEPTPVGATTPFAPGTVSIRLYPHDGLSATRMVSELCAQAGLALSSGFDGVVTSEHHGGFAGYLPNPLQMAGFVLDDHPTGWAAASPLLLPLRPTALVAEETAWLAARHPGRVGLGVAAGALPLDFEAMEIDRSSAPARFAVQLPRLVAMLQGRDLGLLKGDPALARCVGPSRAGAQCRRLSHRGKEGRRRRRRNPDGGDVRRRQAGPTDVGLRRVRRLGAQGAHPSGLAG